MMEYLYYFSVRYWSIAVTITRNERYQVRNRPRPSYELLLKIAKGFCSIGPPVRTFQYFYHSSFEKPKASKRLPSYLCFVRCFCS